MKAKYSKAPAERVVKDIRRATRLAGPHQNIVAHQWPVDSNPALTFAAAFLLRLLDASVSEALHGASALMRDFDQLCAELRDLEPELTAIDRLQAGPALAQVQSVLTWGNAALYT